MDRSETSLATVLLVSRLAADGLDALKTSEYRKICDTFGDPAGLLGQSATDLVSRGSDTEMAERLVRLLDRALAVVFELDRYQESGISTVTEHDSCYPSRLRDRLGSKAPALLHVSGSLELLSLAGVGVVGSRDVTEEGAIVAQEAAERAAALGKPLVSGGARGVDQVAMNAAYQVEGSVIGVLADSLVKTIDRPEVRRAIGNGSTVLCTPYGPKAGFSVGNAMGRNKLIYGLSQLTLVVASDHDSGGTWAGATEALKHGFGQVVVWRGPGEGQGNAVLVERGGIAIDDVGLLESILAQPEVSVEKPPRVVQRSLFSDD